MGKKQKILISIIGITIVLLALLGLTYAYYLTRIQGNTNETSVSITTADLKLEYGDGNEEIEIVGLMPGVDIEAKTFTVTNRGNSKVNDYAVSIEEVINTLSRPEDLTYTLTCVQKKDGVVTGTCTGVDTDPDTRFPKENSQITVNSIDVGYVHEYTLKLVYENLLDTNQSEDMGSTIRGKVQIYGLADTIDLTGTVTDTIDGDYVQINSETKTSQIVGGKYKLIGIKPGIHTLKIKNEKTGYEKTQTIQIDKGDTPSLITGEITLENGNKVNGPIITMTDESREASISVTRGTDSITLSTSTITNYNPFNSGTLAYKILDSAYNVTDTEEKTNGYAIYRRTPTTKPAEEINNADEASLSVTEDNYGNSYYFRGNVKNNYVNYAGMCWRIVSIASDQSIKLLLQDKFAECDDTATNDKNNDEVIYTESWYLSGTDEFGSDENLFVDFLGDTSSYGMANSFKSFQLTLSKNLNNTITDSSTDSEIIEELSKTLKAGDWCYDDRSYSDEYGENLLNEKTLSEPVYYGAYTRIVKNKKPSLKCDVATLTKFDDDKDGEVEESDTNMYVATLTADEVVFAGGAYEKTNSYYFLVSSLDNSSWFTLSPSYREDNGEWIDNAFLVNDSGNTINEREKGALNGWYVTSYDDVGAASYRPSINLKPSINITGTGNGTITSPYVVN